jgi:hypothetical protein
MLVILDGTILNSTLTNLAEGLQAGIAAAEQKGTLIIEVKADGKAIENDVLSGEKEHAGQVGRLEMVSVRPRELMAQTLRNAAGALDEVEPKRELAAEKIAQGELQEAMNELQVVLSAWQTVQSITEKGGQLLGEDLTQARLKGIDAQTPVADCIAALRHVLGELNNALAEQDWSRLGDIVAYDLEALAGDWKMVLGTLADHVEVSTPLSGQGEQKGGQT